MQVKTTYREILRISLPIMVASVAQTILNITDTAFLGRVGEIEMDASSIGGVFYFVLVMIGMALGIGSQIMIARKSGEKKEKEIGSIFDQSLLLMIIFSIVIFFVIEYVSPVFLSSYLKSKDVINQTNLFLHYRAFGIFFVMIAVAYRSFYVGIAETKIITYSSFVMAGINIILDYFLIFGKGGFPKMGIEGAAIASSTAELFGALYYILYTKFQKVDIRFQLLRFKEFNKKSIAKILNLSAPIMMQHLFSMGGWFIFFIVIERMGEHSLAISTVIRNTLIIIMMPIWSYFTATNSMVSNIIGQGRSEDVLPLLKKIISFSVLTIIIIIAIALMFPDFILGISSSDTNLIHDSRNSLLIICIASFVFSFSSILLSAVSGTGSTKVAMVIEFVTIFIYLGYLYVVVTKLNSTVEVAWCAEILYWLLMSIMSFTYLKSKRWKSIKL
jgi:putative MATE family efflux protein